MTKYTLALITHQSRLEDMIDLIKAHETEMSAWKFVANMETAGAINSLTGVQVTGIYSSISGSNHNIVDLIVKDQVSGVIYLTDKNKLCVENIDLLDFLQKSMEEDIPLAVNLSSAEALIHLIADHPEALKGHHIAAKFLEDASAKHE